MSAKRKAAAAAASGADGPDSKRRKLPDLENETVETTSTAGLAFITQIKNARDKRNHSIATYFLTLPDKEKYPAYYQEISLPVALDTIEYTTSNWMLCPIIPCTFNQQQSLILSILQDKLTCRQYPTLTTLESDLKRLVSNAKSYNERNSEVFSDAEKIRKMVSNHMTKVNPAYKDPTYQSFPTPIPGDIREIGPTKVEDPEVDADGETDHDEPTGKPKRLVTLHGPSAEKEQIRRTASSTPAISGAADAGESFKDNTFQQVQEKIVTELIDLKNEDDELISGPFLNLPSRELRDYYSVIKSPQCLKRIQKQVRGIQGREKPNGVSLFKSWRSFEEEMSKIWNNARLYNEDGSNISELAGQLEAYFNRRLHEAKEAVSEPPQPKVKLRLTANKTTPELQPKIMLRMGPKATTENTNGVTVDNEALKRQQDHVKAGANGYAAITNGDSSTKLLASPAVPMISKSATPDQLALDRMSGAIAPMASNGVKSEGQLRQSPAITATVVRHNSNTSSENPQSPHNASISMPPPSSITPRLPSGSPHPQINHSSQNNQISNPLDSRWRQPGKDASDALISNLTVATHPGLKLDNHFHLDIPPSPVLSQQSVTITLPATHYCLQFTPTITPHLAHRQSKIFVIVNNNTRLNPTPPSKLADVDPRCPLYDVRVVPGVNRIDVEMIAGPPRGAPKVGMGQEIELEKITVFINLVR
ncbi:hypothetical protein MMC11_008553 [Xylographa trunciseda]|nr:hypothetical protein [Xylographa trunciseda]